MYQRNDQTEDEETKNILSKASAMNYLFMTICFIIPTSSDKYLFHICSKTEHQFYNINDKNVTSIDNRRAARGHDVSMGTAADFL